MFDDLQRQRVVAAIAESEWEIDGHETCQTSVIDKVTGLPPAIVDEILTDLWGHDLIEGIPVATDGRQVILGIALVKPGRERVWGEDGRCPTAHRYGRLRRRQRVRV